jgi:hypothetical protein
VAVAVAKAKQWYGSSNNGKVKDIKVRSTEYKSVA